MTCICWCANHTWMLAFAGHIEGVACVQENSWSPSGFLMHLLFGPYWTFSGNVWPSEGIMLMFASSS